MWCRRLEGLAAGRLRNFHFDAVRFVGGIDYEATLVICHSISAFLAYALLLGYRDIESHKFALGAASSSSWKTA
ncbi:carbamoyl-phosphate synthase large chain [Methylocaldum marinum]|uniref:Carbamoyl-phosphate synthase large chain n=1 Tax=Methylocaldum marinum TaxID=1432792 RepID=A0A250KNB0_9GAMM|nr:carbamoyl-phosphate synthase large chain [Methylocaldum marinum]